MQALFLSPHFNDLTIANQYVPLRAPASLQTDSSSRDRGPILLSTLHSLSLLRPRTTDHPILSNKTLTVVALCHNVTVNLIASPLFSPLRARLLPDRPPNCPPSIEVRQNQLNPLRLLSDVPSVDPETSEPVSTSPHSPLGSLCRVYLLFPTLHRDSRTCQSLETARATYAPTSKGTPPSRDIEKSRLATRCIFPADLEPDYADRRDLGLLHLVYCSSPLSPGGIDVVCHTAIFVDLGLTMWHFL